MMTVLTDDVIVRMMMRILCLCEKNVNVKTESEYLPRLVTEKPREVV